MFTQVGLLHALLLGTNSFLRFYPIPLSSPLTKVTPFADPKVGRERATTLSPFLPRSLPPKEYGNFAISRR